MRRSAWQSRGPPCRAKHCREVELYQNSLIKAIRMPDLEQFTKLISGLGVSGVLALFVWGISRGWFVTGPMYAALQTQVNTNQAELQRLRDRDSDQQKELGRLRQSIDDQQKEIVLLRKELADEKVLKQQALVRVNALTEENVKLKQRVAELEKTVGGMSGTTVRT